MSAARYELRGWHVLAMILAFFATVIAVNVTFAIYAVRSFPGEDVQRSYLQGLHYNNTLAERRAQQQLGWSAGALLRHEGEGAVLEVTLNARDSSAITNATINGYLEWPTSSQMDRTLRFESLGDGRYVASLADLAPGRWRLRARGESPAGALDFESELTWPSR